MITPRYATLEEAQKMDLGVTGRLVETGNGCLAELLAGHDTEGRPIIAWVDLHLDANGERTGDWDLISKKDAYELGLIPLAR